MLTQNSKLKKTSKKHGLRVYNFGIPAYRSQSGFVTCPNAGACAVGCYAQSGAYRFSNVKPAFERRLEETRKEGFAFDMHNHIVDKRADVIRIHDSGDFYSPFYLQKWLHVADMLPHVQFYAYTKQVEWFKSLQKIDRLPSNMTIIYSYGGIQDHLIDPKVDRHARVFESVDELKAAGYADASNDDLIAIGKSVKIGLVYHGNKGYNKTNWRHTNALNKKVSKP